MSAAMPTITDEQRARLEAKLVSTAVQKINNGASPTKLEMEALENAHARQQAPANAPAAFSFLPQKMEVTELGLEVAVSERLEERGLYDLSRLDARKPEIVKAAVKMLGLGVGVDQIADCLSLDVRTIAAIRDRAEATGAMPGHKEMTVSRLKSLAALMMSKLAEQINAGMPVEPVGLGIVLDKIELLSGGVTSRTESVITTSEDDEFGRLIKQARKVAGMVTDAENISAKGGPRPPAELAESTASPLLPLGSLTAPEMTPRDIECTAEMPTEPEESTVTTC